jgi:hypothetical protein
MGEIPVASGEMADPVTELADAADVELVYPILREVIPCPSKNG